MRLLFQFCWIWFFPWIKLTWHSCFMWDKLGWPNLSWKFFCERLPSFNMKKLYYSYACSCSLFERRTSFWRWLISRKLCGVVLMFLSSLLYSMSYFRFFYWSLSLFFCKVFDSLSSNIDEIPPINLSANVFVFVDFNFHHKDRLTYSCGVDSPGELYYNFSISSPLNLEKRLAAKKMLLYMKIMTAKHKLRRQKYIVCIRLTTEKLDWLIGKTSVRIATYQQERCLRRKYFIYSIFKNWMYDVVNVLWKAVFWIEIERQCIPF